MEPLSRPLHRKQTAFSKKLSNANSFSGMSAYDDVFAGTPKFGARTHSAPIEDYEEIFGGSQASSIPILDLSALDGAKVSADVRRSKLDYSKIFGDFHDEDIAVSYEDMLAKPKGAKSSSDKARTPTKSESPSDGPNQLNRYKEEAFQHAVPNQSFEGMKQVNMSYHKTGQGSNDRTSERTHVAQLRAAPGFTCFIDGNHPLQKTEGDKPVSLAKTDVKSLPKIDANRTQKKTSDSAGKFKSQASWNEFNSTDKSLNTNESSLKTRLSKMSSPSGIPANLVNNKREPKRSMDSNFKLPRSDASKAGYDDCSPSISDEEVDINSAAALSAAALRKAIEKAQASIRVAKELMERKKDGAQRFSKPSSNDGLDVKKQREDQVNAEANKISEKNAKDICENADVILQVFTKSERGKARRSGKVAPDFKESEQIFISKEVIGEANENKLESADDCEELRQHSGLVDTAGGRNATLACEHADGRNNIAPSVCVPESEKEEIGTAEETIGELDGNVKEVDEEAQELEDLEGKENTVKMAGDWKQHVYRLDTNHVTKEVYEHEETEKTGTAQGDNKTKEMHRSSSRWEKCEKELEESLEPNENVEVESQEEKANNNEEGLDESQKCFENEMKQEVFEEQSKQNENVEVESQEEKANKNEERLDEAQKCLENRMKQEVFEEQSKQSLKDAHEGENKLKNICDRDGIEMGPQADYEWVDCEEAYEVESTEERQNDACEAEDNQMRLDEIHKLEINKRLNATADGEENEGQEVDINWEGKEEIPTVEACEYEETESIHSETVGNESTEVNKEAEETMNLDATSDACEQDASESLSESEEFHRHKQNDNDLNCEETERISDATQSSCEFMEDENEWEAIEVAHVLGGKEICRMGGFIEGAAEHVEIENKMKDTTEAFLFNDNSVNNSLSDTISGPKQTDQDEKESDLDSNLGNGIKISVCESGKDEKNVREKIASDLEEVKSNFGTGHEKREWAETGEKIETSQPSSMFKGEEKTKAMDGETEKSQITEKNEENLNKTFAVERNKSEETEQKEVKAEKEDLRKNNKAEAIKRERERDRIAVERAIREARERAFAEARERAERAAVERATAEARQRVMAEAREKYEKASTSTKSSAVKCSIEAKLRAERAAVERATAEARERALERALSQKATSGAREKAERIVAEKFSGVSRDNGMRQSFPSSDAQKLDGNNGESAQRCKAILERHQRITERAAIALAEKNKRDLLAQKEQAERNRLAETLDAEVKRWSSAKEGNLRALLSTLQYILGPDSGWQPISLTDIIATNAVKKAYRKATLHVHPDKLQQRGASIQQKYICEKVFDLLKAAWNKFNFEEK